MNVAQSLMTLDRYIARRWRDNPVQEASNLTYTEYDYLETISEAKAIRLSDLAEQMKVSKPTASNMVRRLENKELLSRKPCQNDRRATYLALSPQGENILLRDRQFYNQLLNELLQTLSEEDRNILQNLLAQVVSRTTEDICPL